MSKTRRQFTLEGKHSIFREAEREGATETARKYNLAHSVLSYWKSNWILTDRTQKTEEECIKE